jgi:hypothetical protein
MARKGLGPRHTGGQLEEWKGVSCDPPPTICFAPDLYKLRYKPCKLPVRPGSCALAQDFGVSEAEAPQGGQGGGERALEPAPRVQGEFWNGKSEIGRARRGRSNGQNLVTSQELWARPRAETIAAQCVFVGTCCRREKRCRPSGEPEASPRVVCGRAPGP